YADDCIIALKSEASAKRVMRTITIWIEKKLGLKVNMTKTHITKPQNLKYLGFGFYYNPQTKTWRSRPHKDSVKRFERKLKQLTCRRKNMSFKIRVRQLNPVIRGWINYYAISDMKTTMMRIDAHLRTRLRVILWKQWKVPSGRYHWLRKLGVNHNLARQTSYMGDHYQFVASRTCVKRAISKQRLVNNGLISCFDYYLIRHKLEFN
ncbi:group II intron maturase-specific domain-containing protein, partial [Faecalibacillus faecis]|uniref:group II intron maturase-specific domain-containing protein n=2 Tax=Coprobacillaceae TaxID=2810280 RepID=UPI002E7935AC